MEKLLVELKKIKPEIDFKTCTELVDEGILDSLDIVEITTAIEEQYEVEIDPSYIDPDNFQSADAMWKMIQELKNIHK